MARKCLSIIGILLVFSHSSVESFKSPFDNLCHSHRSSSKCIYTQRNRNSHFSPALSKKKLNELVWKDRYSSLTRQSHSPNQLEDDQTHIWNMDWRKFWSGIFLSCFLTFSFGGGSLADDELAKYAAEGNQVGVDPACFWKKCSLELTKCSNNPDCMKGLNCLAKCKGDSMCSTGCFSKFGNSDLDNMLYCSVEKEDCVHVPRDESRATWDENDKLAPPIIVENFQPQTLEGKWYKVLGLDTRYDCFDCQSNDFSKKQGISKDKKEVYEAKIKFRMPRQRAPGYYENNLNEELIIDPPGSQRTMHTVGRMFGLTFWENWYVIGESDPSSGLPPFKFIYYTGHTLQGNYKGAFVYARTTHAPPEIMPEVSKIAQAAGLDFESFCQIRNSCFEESDDKLFSQQIASFNNRKKRSGLWFLGTEFLQQTKSVAAELSDWFEDPTYLSDWLLDQQEKMILNQPLEVSPFSNLLDDEDSRSITKFLFEKRGN